MSDPAGILNWRRVNDQVTLSGQPTEAQLAEIAAMGVRHIINLGPHTNDGALDDEPGTVRDCGMTYTYIPVDFDAPTDADFDQFCAALTDIGDAPVHIHCIYNARVTAFVYRLAKTGKLMPEAEAFAMMDGIWRPGKNWAAFIGDDTAADRPNTFAGYEY